MSELHIFKKGTEADSSYGDEMPDFSGTDFSNADLRDADVDISKNSFDEKAGIQGASFRNAHLENFRFYDQPVYSMAFLPGGDLTALGGSEVIILLSKERLKLLQRIPYHGFEVLFSPDGKYLVHSRDGHIYLRDTKGFEIVIEHELSEQLNPDALNIEDKWIWDFAFSPDAKLLYVACINAVIYVFDVERRTEVYHYACWGKAGDIELSANGDFMACFGFNTVTLWDTRTKERILFMQDKPTIYSAKFHPFQDLFVVTDGNSVRIYDPKLKEFILEHTLPGASSVEFSRDGEYLYIEGKRGLFQFLWNSMDVLKKIHFDKLIEQIPRWGEFYLLEMKVSENGRSMYLRAYEKVMEIDIQNEIVLNTYRHLPALYGADFTNCTGLDEFTLQQIEKNGGIVGSGDRKDSPPNG